MPTWDPPLGAASFILYEASPGPEAKRTNGPTGCASVPTGCASGKTREYLDMPTETDVRHACLLLPGVVERESWGQPAWFARTLMARIWEDGVLTVKTDEREALVAGDPATFFWTPHHERSPQLVLLRLQRVNPDELTELLHESYRIAGGTRRS